MEIDLSLAPGKLEQSPTKVLNLTAGHLESVAES